MMHQWYQRLQAIRCRSCGMYHRRDDYSNSSNLAYNAWVAMLFSHLSMLVSKSNCNSVNIYSRIAIPLLTFLGMLYTVVKILERQYNIYTIYLVTSTEELGQYHIIKYINIFTVKYRNRVKICCQINYEKNL